MSRRLTMRMRLTLAYTAVALTLMIALGLAVYLSLRVRLDKAARAELSGQAQGIVQMLDRKVESGQTSDILDDLQELSEMDPRSDAVELQDARGAILFQSHGSERLLSRVQTDGFSRIRVKHKTFFVLRRFVTTGGGYVVSVASDRSAYDEVLEDLRRLLLLGIPVALGLSFAAGLWMSGRALHPIQVMSGTVREIDDRRLAVRLPLRGSGDELDLLAQTLNRMLDRLEASFEQIRRFTADASHELRTPLALIRGNAEMMRMETSLHPSTERRCQELTSEADRMLLLMQSLLELARSDSGAEQGMEVIDPADLTRRAEEFGRRLAEQTTVRFTVEAPRSIYPLCGNDLSLSRVLVILLDNAFRHTSPGKDVRLVVRSQPSECRFEVIDSGSGIDPIHLPRIFDRFYRVEDDRNRSTGGAGLGLSIAKSIVAAHSGRISVESTPGVGSTFVVLLPNQSRAGRT